MKIIGYSSSLSKISNHTYDMISESKLQELQNLTRLKKRAKEIKDNIIKSKKERHKTIAEMFLAGPSAWPDYPEYEDVDFDEEEWIPLN